MSFGVDAQPGGSGHQDVMSELGAGSWQRPVSITELPHVIPT